MILRCCTCSCDTLYIGISKLIEMGPISFLTFEPGPTTNLHAIVCVVLPTNLRMSHVIVLVASSYSHVWPLACAAISQLAPVLDLGTVNCTLTLAPWYLSANSARTCSRNSCLYSVSAVSIGVTRNGICPSCRNDPIWKFISTNSPCGGSSTSIFCCSNLSSCTHSWKLTLSSSTMPYPAFTPEPAMTSSSLRASCNSGEPVRYDFIWIEPSIENVRTWPLELKVAEMRSITSTKISFLSDRDDELGSEIGLCTALEDMVFCVGLSDGRSFDSLGLATGAASLKTNACSSAVDALCG
mmetsp:Transcript_1638/g.4148  ORF Transcript_1638/g.4148 Transcript_1638/m.4148 type:complete len:297 (-) Transcript_1638:460-1350(-)